MGLKSPLDNLVWCYYMLGRLATHPACFAGPLGHSLLGIATAGDISWNILCKRGFSTVLQLLKKQGSRLDIAKKDDLRLLMSDIKHHIELLIAEHQVYAHIEPDDNELLNWIINIVIQLLLGNKAFLRIRKDWLVWHSSLENWLWNLKRFLSIENENVGSWMGGGTVN